MAADNFSQAFGALDGCDEALRRLDTTCCEPGRSPRMAALAETLVGARTSLQEVSDDPRQAEAVFASLEDAGSQVGWLQVGCCALDRMPLYAEILENLTTVQRAVSRSLGQGH